MVNGALGAARALAATLSRVGQFHFQPAAYLALMRREMPDYDRLEAETAAATGRDAARRVLELGVGTGETTRRVLECHPDATVLGIDANEDMLARAAETLPADRVALRAARLEDPLPDGPFELVVSALCVHHLDAAGKADLFRRVAAVLAPEGAFVIGDIVVPEDPADAITPIDGDYDVPDRLDDQLDWLAEAGFQTTVPWTARDLAVIAARRP
jgi:tRNA (cmo5U34)-methyltransferase